jgi:hypothetical protein
MGASIVQFKQRWWAFALIISVSPTANADAIIPYMVVPWGQAVLLPLVIIIESVILNWMLGGSIRSNLFQSFVANLTSTALGFALYFATMPMVNDGIFHWWFLGEFSSEAFRSACIALLFATVLWAVSWISETVVIRQMRDSDSTDRIRFACAVANLVTYALLLTLAMWFGRGISEVNVEADIDRNRNSKNIESLLKATPEYPFVGFWKNECSEDFGLAFEAAGDGKYTVNFCGPGACGNVERLTPVSLENNQNYRIIDQNTIEEQTIGGISKLYRCEIN